MRSVRRLSSFLLARLLVPLYKLTRFFLLVTRKDGYRRGGPWRFCCRAWCGRGGVSQLCVIFSRSATDVMLLQIVIEQRRSEREHERQLHGRTYHKARLQRTPLTKRRVDQSLFHRGLSPTTTSCCCCRLARIRSPSTRVACLHALVTSRQLQQGNHDGTNVPLN